MRITSINPDTKPGVNCASTNPNAASGAQLALDNPAAAPGAQLASADLNAALGSRLASVTPDATSVPLCGAAAEVQAMLPASPMFSMAFRYNVQRALLNGVRGGRRQPLWVQRLRGAEALGAAAAHPEHPMMRETLNECADGYLDLNALTRLLSAIRAGQVRVYEVHTDAPSPLCLNLRRQVEAEMMYDTAIPSAAVTLSKEALLTLAPTEEAVKSASRPARAPRSADELHARLLSEGDLLAGEACAPAEWMDALELAGRAVYIEPGLWIARENEDEYRLALEENDAAALSRVVRRTARFHGAQTAETLSERYAVDEVRAQEALNTLCSEGILREFGGTYVHAELYESAQRMTVALNRQRVETQPARAFARMLSQRVRGAGSSAAQLAQALVSLRGCTYPAAAWEGYLLPARVANYRPQLLDEALARGEAAYRVLPAERPQLPGETRAQAAARPCGAASSDARVSIDGSRLLGKTVVRDEAAERPRLPGETRAQAAARPRGAAPSGARVSIDGSWLPGEAAERPQLPGETRAQAAARPYGAAPSGARVSIDVSQFPGEAAVRDEAAYRVLPAERSRLPNETRAQAAARARDAAPSDARVSIDGSQLPGEAAVRDEAAYRVLPAERPQLPGETAVRVLSGERSQLSGETAARVQSGETADSRSIPAPEIDGVPANPLAASRVRGSAASAFELHAQRRGTAVLDQSGSAHPESGLRDGRAIFGERTRASRAASGERVRVQFDLPDDEGEYEPLPDDLTDMERDVLQTLTARGASFASRLPVNAGDALKSLLARGLVRADSFLPVREMLATESGNVKKTVRRRVRVMDAGRWSRVGVLPQTSAEALVERLFDRFGIVCRETAGADWNAAFGVLKHMEYAGKARRGYFVKGLSGAQFMRETDYSTITAQLRQPSGECVWLPAADPMQAWGAYLAHEEGRAFLRVPGAAVALMDGAVVAVSEKQGETLRVFDDPAAPEALRALADAFRRGAIFPTLPRLLIKKYPPTAAAHLEAAGFTREMLDYTLMRRG